MFGKFHSVLTNNQLPQANSGTTGDVWYVNATGLLWFVVGDGSLIQLLQSVPIPVKGDPGPIGLTGATGGLFPSTFQYSGNWQPSPAEFVRGSVTQYNGFLYVSLADLNISTNVLNPEGNPFWSIIGPVNNVRNAELVTICDGAGSQPNLGYKGTVTIPFDCTIQSFTLCADQNGSCEFDVKYSSTFAGVPVSIVGSANPQLVNQTKVQGNVSTWSPLSLAAGSILEIDLLSVSTALFLTLCIQISATN
jgi:hypothetical protein